MILIDNKENRIVFKMVLKGRFTQFFHYCQSEESDAVSRPVLLTETYMFIIFQLMSQILLSERSHANTSPKARQAPSSPTPRHAVYEFLQLHPTKSCIHIANMHGMHGLEMVYNKMALIIVIRYRNNSKHTGEQNKNKGDITYKLLVLMK